MKYPLKNHILILSFLLSISVQVKSQESANKASGFSSIFKEQADSLKEKFSKQGFIVVKEAKMNMESEYEMPVIVPLKEGTSYEFAFIGDRSSKLYEVRMYDENEKEVVYLKQVSDGTENNVISYPFIPQFSSYHIIKPLQINKMKKKNICGYIMMFKKVN